MVSTHVTVKVTELQASELRARAAQAEAEVVRLRAERDRLADQVEAMAKVLLDLEWDADAECPWCHESDIAGHAADCALSTALAEVTR